MPLASVFEREHGVDPRAELPGCNVLHYDLVLLRRARARSQHLPLGAECGQEIERDNGATVASAEDKPPVLAQRAHARHEEVAADVLDNHVDAATIGELKCALGDLVAVVINDGVCSFLKRERELCLAPCRRDHAGTGELGDLDGGEPDPACCSADEHRFPGSHMSARREHVPRSDPGGLARGGELERDILG